MFKNYIKIAWRNIVKNKVMFGINILGLAVGIASCLIIMLFVTDEFSYDRYNEKADDIVRVVFKAKINGEKINEAVVMAPVGQALKEEFPEVLDATRFRIMGTPKVVYNDVSYRNGRFAYVDPNFFDVFTLPILKGDKASPLKEPNTIILTEDEAIKYFGNENPIGKILKIDAEGEQFKVTAIIDKVPDNSHFHFDMMASMEGHNDAKQNTWMNSNFYTYLLLKKGTDYKNLESKLSAIFQRNVSEPLKEAFGLTYTEFTKENKLGLFLQPLTDIYLSSEFSSRGESESSGSLTSLYIFAATALFMLMIACINFMNLSTASATKRSKEVGIRKVLGSKKKQIIKQFLTESFISTLIATLIALIFVIIMLPFFNEISGKELQVSYLLTPKIFATVILSILLISLLAGTYPAFYISSFKPILALKSKFSGTGNTKGIRSGLVVFQFVISTGLILATIVVSQQMSFIQNKELGYDKDQLLVIRESYFLENNQEAFKNKILSDPRVINVTTSAFVPVGDSDNNMSSFYIDQQFNRRMFVYNIDENYIPTMKMELLKGRNFSKEFGVDSLNAIINETSARILGFGDDAIGKSITRGTNNQGGRQTLKVIGVVKDFHYRSLHEKIDPLIMLNDPYGGFIIRANVADMSDLVKSMSAMWNSFNVEQAFNYTVMDDSYNLTYVKEQRLGTILKIFALLTIFVACLGLFGLVTFTAEQRIKEIGIRKVLGSSVAQIVGLLTKDFIKLIIISFLIAFPLGIYLMNKWLQDFAYRIDISVESILLAALITTLVAFLTISFKSIKAATMNPIKSLKTE
ncbi:ABC transporter permease [Sediminibacter sp. Hel_I_10]|uniref:ABC transporter permease n=1 Tax=Sediminibacter sp. Hel_I_10 TaxID=1392490 RepID=UPI00047AFE4C|nr:ABC transporter permease [Sediminibacter sp. Hel_I_10]